MYKREMLDLPDSLVKGGKPVFGTFKGHPHFFDIRGIYRPFGVFPLPTFITDSRIKNRLIFTFKVGSCVGRVSFVDAQVVDYMEILLWNRATGQKYAYHSLLLPRKNFVPDNMEKGSACNYLTGRYARVGWNRVKNKLSVVLDLKGDAERPFVRASFTGSYDGLFSELVSVRPDGSFKRSRANYNSMMPLKGHIIMLYKNGETKTMSDNKGLGAFDITKSFIKFRSRGKSILGFGEAGGKAITFRMAAESENAVAADEYNCNVLFYDGKATPLPPVVISHYRGIYKNWVIQDTENMVDLTFTPTSIVFSSVNAFVVRTVYQTMLGYFEGTLMTADGEKVSFKSLTGLTETYLIRL